MLIMVLPLGCCPSMCMYVSAAHIKAFLNFKETSSTKTRLEAHLNPDNTFKWFHLTSRCSLDTEVQVCIKALVNHNQLVQWEGLSSVQPQHAAQYLTALQTALTDSRQKCKVAEERLQQNIEGRLLIDQIRRPAYPTEPLLCRHCSTLNAVYACTDRFTKKVCFSCGRCN
jgi:hypothetical protein